MEKLSRPPTTNTQKRLSFKESVPETIITFIFLLLIGYALLDQFFSIDLSLFSQFFN